MRRGGPHSMIGPDPAAVAGAKLSRQLLRRVWTFARPYRRMIFGFLAIIVAAALVSLAPPLLFREILDQAIPNDDRRLVWVLAGVIVAAALADAGLALGERYLRSEEHTSELPSLMRISYAVFCLKKKLVLSTHKPHDRLQ